MEDSDLKGIYPKVFLWMFIGLLISGVTAFLISTNYSILLSIFTTPLYLILVIVDLILVIVLSWKIRSLSPMVAKIMYIVYALINGATLASIFVVYELGSIYIIFLVSALIFGIFAFIGAKTETDLTKMGTFLFMGLLGIIIVSLVNLFIGSSMLEIIISVVAVLLFVGITAYDMQKIKRLTDVIPEENLAIYGALELYLDFINIFIRLLSLFGRRK